MVQKLATQAEANPAREALPALLSKTEIQHEKAMLCSLYGISLDDAERVHGLNRHAGRSFYRMARVIAGIERRPMPDPDKELRDLLRDATKMEQVTMLAEHRYELDDIKRILGKPLPIVYYYNYRAIIDLVRPWRLLPLPGVLRHELQAFASPEQKVERMAEYRLTVPEMQVISGLDEVVLREYLWRQAVRTNIPAAKKDLSGERDIAELLAGARSDIEKVWRLMPYGNTPVEDGKIIGITNVQVINTRLKIRTTINTLKKMRLNTRPPKEFS